MSPILITSPSRRLVLRKRRPFTLTGWISPRDSITNRKPIFSSTASTATVHDMAETGVQRDPM